MTMEIISYGRFQCKELSPHKNRGMEITYVEKGMLEWMVEGVPERIAQGSIFFTLPWQVHGSMNPREPDNTVCHVLFHLKQDYFMPRANFLFPACFGFSPSEMEMLSSAFAASRHHGFRATPAMRWLMPALVNELQGSHELREVHSVTLLRGVLVELKRIVTGETVDEETYGWSEKRVQALLHELSTSCDQRWTLKRMAEQCSVRRTRLNTLFVKLTGVTPVEYLARVRMERAKTLVRETDMKIIDIAMECGFGSSQYFANTFRRSTGMTPSSYRRHRTALSREDVRKWRVLDFRSEQEERRRVRDFSAD